MNKRRTLIHIAIIILCFAFTAILLIRNAFMEIEYYTEDIMYMKPGVIPSNIKIIKIDEKTLQEFGQFYSWDRSYYADLIDVLYSGDGEGPKVLGFDILFSGENNDASDARLIESASAHDNIVMVSKLEWSNKAVKGDDGYYIDYFVNEEIRPFDGLNENVVSGFTTPIFEKDGYIRRANLQIKSGDEIYDAFALQMAELGGETVNDKNIIEFKYTGNPDDFETISFVDVLNGKPSPGYFDGSYVLVGAYAEALMDAYSVPINHSVNMYGVEIQANLLYALINGYSIKHASLIIELLIMAVFFGVLGFFSFRKGFLSSIIVFALEIAFYLLLALGLFNFSLYKLSILYLPIGLAIIFVASILVRYVEAQKARALEMQKMLFSMATSMAEAIEGRTPYNANHTKNVATRCVEMLRYINRMHKEKRTDMFFSEKDINQMYLAAMLHDVGKMDVPLEVMDKPTKLGTREEKLRDRLEIIKLHIINDKITGIIDADEAEKEIADIDTFVSKLGLYNCGKPLDEEDKAFIENIGQRKYENGSEIIEYLTKEEIDDLRINAGTLSDDERNIMQSHVLYTDKILSHVYFGQDYDKVRNMASNHHELLNGEGYPNNLEADDLDVMTRILTIMDIFDSLIADDRPYKKPKTVKAAFEILDEEAQNGKVDEKLLAIAKEIWMEV